MIFNKAILLLCAAVSPFALAEPASTVTLTVVNAHSSTPTPTPTPTPSPSPSSTPVHKFIASTGTGARFTPSAGRWNSTLPIPSNPVKAPSEPASSAASGPASGASSPAATGAAAGHDVAGAAMMAGVVAVAGLVML
ncbi:hypothetical protein DTO166G4_7891 [Paecilomyces variotii]|nr:hypothetical protein DTO166G4_7891 [Paecilomyces variotii]KAJ9230425.1 hypothetical protein DTO166G5_7317 [Paecilomyces variotii]KAJ9232031.1 hypothetical protein DTO169E5_7671 [Paecilomyces variotii]KAJ9247072.1 hypothetical protein DTO207G8_8387 [Paecilomyces variotii]KAJ9273831.1 hypothetical protein DTO212C5_110 [Paecilomyces variotii]